MWYDQMLMKGRKDFLNYLNHDLIRDLEIKTTLGKLDDVMIPSGRDPQEALVMFNRVGETRWNSLLFYVKARVFNENWTDEKEFIRFYNIEKIIVVMEDTYEEIEWSELSGPQIVDPQDQYGNNYPATKHRMSENTAIWWKLGEYFTQWFDISSFLYRRFTKDSDFGMEMDDDTALNILMIPRQLWPDNLLYQDAINKKVI